MNERLSKFSQKISSKSIEDFLGKTNFGNPRGGILRGLERQSIAKLHRGEKLFTATFHYAVLINNSPNFCEVCLHTSNSISKISLIMNFKF